MSNINGYAFIYNTIKSNNKDKIKNYGTMNTSSNYKKKYFTCFFKNKSK